jgi:hypothetical protein
MRLAMIDEANVEASSPHVGNTFFVPHTLCFSPTLEAFPDAGQPFVTYLGLALTLVLQKFQTNRTDTPI